MYPNLSKTKSCQAQCAHSRGNTVTVNHEVCGLGGLVTISKVLLVDDNIDHLAIFYEGLERYGFSVKAYVSPLKALEEFHPGLYNVAIVDVMMDTMNGIDLS